MWVTQGRLGAALAWVRERSLSAEDDLSYLREFEHITLARVLLARDTAERAERSAAQVTGLLERLLSAAEEGQRTGSVIEILVVQALAHQARGDIPAALAPLQRALGLADREGYVRTFVDGAAPMAFLLGGAAKQGTAPKHLRRVLAAVGRTGDSKRGHRGAIDRLSAREMHVLRLLGTDLDGPQIARELFVSLNTVRTHTKNIYAKLGVNNRRAAVRKAEDLDLMSESRRAGVRDQ
jgi:LuxR family maltose regulon positive regulatory protein